MASVVPDLFPGHYFWPIWPMLGWGIGLALEGRLYKHFGVEIDFIRDSSTLQRDATFNNVLKYTTGSGAAGSLTVNGYEV